MLFKNDMMLRKAWFLLIFFFVLTNLYAQFREDAYYRLWGAVELRSAPEFVDASLEYVTLNHEGGLPVKVLEIGSSAVRGDERGFWVRVMTTSWAWAQNESRIPQYGKFWVFWRDDDIAQPMR